jgi:YgiT-type zinc finger domain-containing protein
MGERLSAEANMKCTVCKSGDVVPAEITVTLERGPTTVVIKAVPARVCTNCGEEYVDEQTTRRLADVAEIAARTGADVEVRQFAAA